MDNRKLTNADLAEIKKRAEAATGVEWDYDVVDGGISDGNFMVAMGDLDAEGLPVIKAKEADLEFIAQARQDVPALLAEVERLHRTVTIYEQALKEIEDHNEYYSGNIADKALTEALRNA